MNAHDIVQLFDDNLVAFNGKLIHFLNYSTSSGKFKYVDIETGKTKYDVFDFAKFSNPSVRLGYVNHPLRAVYVEKFPIRQYRMGVCQGNISTASQRGHNRAEDRQLIQFSSPSFVDMLNGVYPDIKEAYEQAEEFETEVAFDRQFAIRGDRNIYFCGRDLIGRWVAKSGEITFKEGKEFYGKMLEKLK